MQPSLAQHVEIFSAPWVLPISAPALAEGAVAVAEGRILAVGPRAELLASYRGVPEERCQALLMPGLVNGHCHLELSHLGDIPAPAPGEPLATWISRLLARRGAGEGDGPEILARASEALREQGRAGTVLVADIGNTLHEELWRPAPDLPEVLPLLELLAPTRPAVAAALERLAGLDDALAAAAHAPYSTAAEVLRAVKARCRRLGQVFSVHCAESREEVDFIGGRGGPFEDFLRRRGAWDGTLDFSGRGHLGSAAYLHALGLLDGGTLLVHGVHLSTEELGLIAATGSHLCLCPGSNQTLAVGRAPLPEMLAAGLLPALGTDSRASNPSLDLWREMRLLAIAHPRVEPSLVLAMATRGGALALGRDVDYGSLAPGRVAAMLAVDSPELARCQSAEAVYAALVNGGQPPLLCRIGSGRGHGQVHNSAGEYAA